MKAIMLLLISALAMMSAVVCYAVPSPVSGMNPNDVLPSPSSPDLNRIRTALSEVKANAAKISTTLPFTDSPAIIPLAMHNQPRCSYIDLGGGSIYYEEQGQGHPVILLHGDGLDRRMWDDQFAVLAQYYRVIRYDARCHGLSSTPGDNFCHQADLCCLIRHLGIEKATLVGISTGACIAADLALARPEKVAGLILISPVFSDYQTTDPQILACEAKIRTTSPDDEKVEQLLQTWADGPYRCPSETNTTIRSRIKEFYTSNLQALSQSSREKRFTPLAMDRLAEIGSPTLVVVGDMDRACVQEIGRKMEKEIGDSKRVTIRNAAHWVNLEKPAEINQILLEYLSQTIPWRIEPKASTAQMVLLQNLNPGNLVKPL